MPAICSPGLACALVSSSQSPIWGVHVNGGVTHPTPAICRAPARVAQEATQTRKMTSTPVERTSKDLMKPFFSPCNQILFLLQSVRRGFFHSLQWGWDLVLPRGSACCKGCLKRTELGISPKSLSLHHCYLLKDTAEIISDPNLLLFPVCTGCHRALLGDRESPLFRSWPCADSYTELSVGWAVLLSPA